MSKRRKQALVAITVLCLGGGLLFLVLASQSPNQVTADARSLPGPSTELAGSQLIVRTVDREDPRLNGEVFVLKGGHPRRLAGAELDCERVHFAAGRGLCLATAETGIGYQATIFDSSLQELDELQLAGLPSRARVSKDGKLGAMTVFVNGHAYLGSGSFSTTTTIVDMQTGEQVANLESFTVSKEGKPLDAVDFNFWGVTFSEDSNRFFATLRTEGHYYLVEGDLAEGTMRVLRDRVECPSLSPDGTRIAYKSRIGDENRWQLKVLDLDTLHAHAIADRRPIDDQVEWLDDDTLVYSDGLDVYTASADGGGRPRLVLRDATSPTAL